MSYLLKLCLQELERKKTNLSSLCLEICISMICFLNVWRCVIPYSCRFTLIILIHAVTDTGVYRSIVIQQMYHHQVERISSVFTLFSGCVFFFVVCSERLKQWYYF